MKFAFLALCALTLSASALPAGATLVAYSTRADFIAALSTAGTDSFDDLMVGTELPAALSRTAGTFGYRVNAGPASDFLTASDGASDVWLSTNVGTDDITIDAFTGGVRGIGGSFFATDLAGYPAVIAAMTITATDGDGSSIQSILSPSPEGFTGFISSREVQSLVISIVGQPGVWATVNDVTLGTVSAVPELPAAWLLLAGIPFTWTARRITAQRSPKVFVRLSPQSPSRLNPG